MDQVEPGEALSALVDGELSADELTALLEDSARADGSAAQWARYQLIGEVLRGSQPCMPSTSPVDFLARISPHLTRVPSTEVSQPTEVVKVRAEAANAAVFRWKLVASLASIVAVVAVGWGSLGLLGAGFVPQSAAALAGAPTQLTTADGAQQPLVVVDTGHGAVLRDPQLEALLTEHRQFGGLSALQMPAGFLRNATHDASPQR